MAQQKLLLLSTGAMALAISYPSAHAEIFRMTCTPDSSSIPYTVTYDSDVGASYITGGRSGTTRKYNVLDIKNKTSVHVLYVATKAPNQTRTVYLAFDYSGKGDDVSASTTIDGASDKKDKCVFIPSQVVAQVAPPQADSGPDKLAPAKALTLTMACEGYNVVFSPGSLTSHAPKKDRDYPITKVDVQNDRIVVTGVTKYGKITAFFSNDGHPSIVWTNRKDVVLNQCASDVAASPQPPVQEGLLEAIEAATIAEEAAQRAKAIDAPVAEAPNADQTLSAERKKVLDDYASILALNSPDASLGDSLRHCDAQWHRSRIMEKYWVDAETCMRRAIADANRSKQRTLDAIVPPPSSDELTYVDQKMRGFSIESKPFYEASKYSRS